MITIDTNILVRIVVDDEDQPEQTRQAQALVEKAGAVFLPQIVQVELVWVLSAAYEFTKSEVVGVLRYLLESSFYQLQHADSFAAALERFETGGAGFADALIAVESQNENTGLWTFDRKLSQQDGVIRLTEQALSEYSG